MRSFKYTTEVFRIAVTFLRCISLSKEIVKLKKKKKKTGNGFDVTVKSCHRYFVKLDDEITDRSNVLIKTVTIDHTYRMPATAGSSRRAAANCSHAWRAIRLTVEEVSVIIAEIQQSMSSFDVRRFAVSLAHIFFLRTNMNSNQHRVYHCYLNSKKRESVYVSGNSRITNSDKSRQCTPDSCPKLVPRMNYFQGYSSRRRCHRW